jgi:hypothetical protein
MGGLEGKTGGLILCRYRDGARKRGPLRRPGVSSAGLSRAFERPRAGARDAPAIRLNFIKEERAASAKAFEHRSTSERELPIELQIYIYIYIQPMADEGACAERTHTCA